MPLRLYQTVKQLRPGHPASGKRFVTNARIECFTR